MFTGIIEGLGTIRELAPAGEGRRMTVEADFVLDDTRIGDSIAVNGACLTAVSLSGRRFAVDIAPETIDKSTFRTAGIGDRVNLERALKLTSRLDGHIVTGHVDGMGRILSRERRSNAIIIEIGVPENLARYLIPKGSVAVDGTSLTVNTVSPGSFSISIIPHTAGLSTVGMKEVGAAVNLETDVVGKYIERFVTTGRSAAAEKAPAGGLDLGFLAQNGFL